jgi:hypothetical protein
MERQEHICCLSLNGAGRQRNATNRSAGAVSESKLVVVVDCVAGSIKEGNDDQDGDNRSHNGSANEQNKVSQPH